MQETQLRAIAERHGAAVVAGDMESVMADIHPDLHEQVPAVAERLPQPTTKADIVAIEPGEGEGVVELCYSGEDGTLTVRSTWALREGRPLIVAVAPVAADG